MSTQKIDYVRQNINKYTKKNGTVKSDTPNKNSVKQVYNDENLPINKFNSNLTERIKIIPKTDKTVKNEKQILKPNPAFERQNSKNGTTNVLEKQIKNLPNSDDLIKKKICLENEYLRTKYLSIQLENKFKKQNQTILEFMRSLFFELENKRKNCLKLEQQLVLKKTLFLMLATVERNVEFLNHLDIEFINNYINLLKSLLDPTLSSVKIHNIKNADNINKLFNLTIDKKNSDLKMDTVQKYSDKVKLFDSNNKDIVNTFEKIHSSNADLKIEIDNRIKSKNIFNKN